MKGAHLLKQHGLNMIAESDAVFFVKDHNVRIGDQEIGFLKDQARRKNLKTVRICMHKKMEAPYS